jgi:hypothetical protein
MNMAKKIIEIAVAKSQKMESDLAHAGQNATLAIAAIKGGIRSPEWRAYMMQFVDQDVPGIPLDPRQLDRLMGIDETKDLAEMDRKRAYLVSNATCGDATPTGLTFGVDSIDEGIASDCTVTTLAKVSPPKKRPSVKKYAKK